jgi:hypothetical protein
LLPACSKNLWGTISRILVEKQEKERKEENNEIKEEKNFFWRIPAAAATIANCQPA